MITGEDVDYETSQEAAPRFPEIPAEQLQRAVAFVGVDGAIRFGAAAVYGALASQRRFKWLPWSYDHVPGFAVISEFLYRVVANTRGFASALTRLLWGSDPQPQSYFWARRWFLRALGFVYLCAFVSFWLQIDGLIGREGVLPIADFLAVVKERLGSRGFSVFPTLCWFNSSDWFLHFLCGSGTILSLLLICGLAPVVCLVLLFVCYLSLTTAGQTFFSFQWDILLLETGFLALFIAPLRLWRWPSAAGNEKVNAGSGRVGQSIKRQGCRFYTRVPRLGLFLLKSLLFKLMLMSGVVKLTAGDDSWWNLTALDYHYWSQPLPTIFAWWADKNPEWFKHFSVAFCLVVEVIVPFFIWAPRRLRLFAAFLLVFLQLVIAITGNYCFFNLLTIAFCILLIDDGTVRWCLKRCRKVEGRARASPVGTSRDSASPARTVRGRRSAPTLPRRILTLASFIVLIITLPINAWLIYNAFKPEADWPRSIAWVYEKVDSFRIISGYGLFRVMTKDRREIIIEGSSDGIDWQPYEFKWKPGDVNRAPGWCAPHQPRLDWQMWFAALSSPQQNRWFLRLAGCLLENKPAVTALLQKNPFPTTAPRYIRASFYRYRFTTASERRETGAWWKREELGEYLPEISLSRE